MSNLSKSANPDSVDAAMEMAEQMEGRTSAPLAKAKPIAPLAAPTERPLPAVDLECNAATPQASAAPRVSSSAISGAAERDADRILGNVAQSYGSTFNSRLQGGMRNFADAREGLLEEAESQVSDWFRSIGG